MSPLRHSPTPRSLLCTTIHFVALLFAMGCGGQTSTLQSTNQDNRGGSAGNGGTSSWNQGGSGQNEGGDGGTTAVVGGSGGTGSAQGGSSTGGSFTAPNCQCPTPPTCHEYTCDSNGQCVLAGVPNGWACSDGDVCTGPDSCDTNGLCQPGGPPEHVTLYEGTNASQFQAIRRLPSGDILLAGNTEWDETTGYSPVWIIANENGKQISRTTLPEMVGGGITTMVELKDRTFLAGYSQKDNENAYGLVIEVDHSGAIVWSQTYGSTESTSIATATATQDTLYVGGSQYLGGAPDAIAWLAALDFSGNLKWEKTYSTDKSDAVTSIQGLANGDVLVAGYHRDFATEKYDAWVKRLAPDSTLIWEKTFVTQKLMAVSGLTPFGDKSILYLDVYDNSQQVWLFVFDEQGDPLSESHITLPDTIDTTSTVLVQDGAMILVSSLWTSLGNRQRFYQLDESGNVTSEAEVIAPDGYDLRVNKPIVLDDHAFGVAGQSWLTNGPSSYANRAMFGRFIPWDSLSCTTNRACLGEPFANCIDADPCLIDQCDGVKGCIHTPSSETNCQLPAEVPESPLPVPFQH